MAYTTIDDPTKNFNTVLYTGNGSTQSITGVGFKPDLVWIKVRSQAHNHYWYDIVRGVQYKISSNSTGGQIDMGSTGLTAFNSDGFSIGDDTDENDNGETYASWNWLAGGSQGSSNTDGTINSTYTSANTTAGFSIVKYTGTGSNATVGHGLGAAPEMIIFKNTNSTRDWAVYHAGMGDPDEYLTLNQTYDSEDGYNFSNNTAPTSSVFSVGSLNGNNGSSQEYIAYCFASKQGFSKFGSYTGNGVASGGGPFIHLGFRPAFFLFKEYSGADNWTMMDSKRLGYNNRNDHLFPNLNNVEYATDRIDMVSNGIKIIDNDGSINQSGSTYIYMAFAESPFVNSNGIPTNAR